MRKNVLIKIRCFKKSHRPQNKWGLCAAEFSDWNTQKRCIFELDFDYMTDVLNILILSLEAIPPVKRS